MQSNRLKVWGLAGSALLLAALVTGSGPRAAVETQQVQTGVPAWLALYAVAVRPNGNVYVVGAKGLLLTSKDHGRTWERRVLHERPGDALFQDRDLYCIRFDPTGQTAWVVGEDGVILHSDDEGQTWEIQRSGVTVNLLKVAVVDKQTAYAVGEDGVTVRTADGGKSWQKSTYKHVILFDVAFTDPNNGWVVGEFQTVLGTSDGGKTWQLRHGGNTGDFTIGPYFAVNFSDPQHGLITGLAGQLLVTDDGGKTWKDQKLPEEVATYVATKNTGALWLGGAEGKLFRQQAGGEWSSMRSRFDDITDMVFAGPIGYAVGLNGTILRTENAGEQWQLVK